MRYSSAQSRARPGERTPRRENYTYRGEGMRAKCEYVQYNTSPPPSAEGRTRLRGNDPIPSAARSSDRGRSAIDTLLVWPPTCVVAAAEPRGDGDVRGAGNGLRQGGWASAVTGVGVAGVRGDSFSGGRTGGARRGVRSTGVDWRASIPQARARAAAEARVVADDGRTPPPPTTTPPRPLRSGAERLRCPLNKCLLYCCAR